MGSAFSGGGGGGKPPKAQKPSQVDTSLTGPLYTQSAATGDEWANLMRGSYGLGQSTGPASWEAKYLGPGALAMMGQAKIPWSGQADPQVMAAEKTAGFGTPPLGGNPFKVSEELGQQFKAPLGQLQRAQGFTGGLTSQWKPPQLRLTGEDLLNVAMGNATQSAQAAQQAFAQAVQGQSAATQAQGIANAAALNAWGNVGAGAIKAAFNSPSLTQGTSGFFGNLFGGYQGDMAAGASAGEYGGGS